MLQYQRLEELKEKVLPMILTFMKTILKKPLSNCTHLHEGDSNPDDEAVVYGITTKSGENGVL
jgi:hypothetical protein